MTRKIYKYPLDDWAEDYVNLGLPKGAQILKAGFDPDGILCLWALVDSDRTVSGFEVRTFRVYGTGFNVTDETVYIDTVIDGMFVWHVFEIS